jgi:hypothetical protein
MGMSIRMSIRASARVFAGSLLAALAVSGMLSVSAGAFTWEVLTTPNPAMAKASQLYGVSCVDAEDCMTVGDYVNGSGTQETLSERMTSGVWSVVYPENPTGTQPALLNASCPTATFCMAVGSYLKSPGEHEALAEEWNGTVWKLQSLPMPVGETVSELGTVSCVNNEECLADGDFHDSTGQHFLVERWTSASGTWSAMTPAAPASAVNPGLIGIHCPGVKECMVVGVYTSSGVVISVSDEWKSGVWTIRNTVNPAGDTHFYPVSTFCQSLTHCLMVGFYTNSTGSIVTLGEEWSGVTPAWSLLTTVNSSDPTNKLLGVACPSSFKICYAVGESIKGSVTKNLAEESGGGGSWSLVSIPAPATATSSVLNRVTCTGVSSCITVGSYVNSSGITVTLVDRN